MEMLRALTLLMHCMTDGASVSTAVALHPTSLIKARAMRLDVSAVMKLHGAFTDPLCKMARRTRWRLSGDSRWTLTDPAPALSPKSVNELASPPNA